jgi:serine/threonine-protein kinase
MSGEGIPAEGQRFGPYRLRDQLGRGGMGVVYRAEHVHLGRIVALKVLAPELSGNREFGDRFLRESRLAATLEHPNVVTVYDAGDVDGALYLAMHLIKGEDLASLLARRGALDPEEAVARLEQVASALDAAHSAGLVHRDVKPQNVLIEGDRTYLTDFGLTKRTTQSDLTAMTATGVFLGTPDYAAPEQITGSAVDARTDVYALAAMLHECVTGSRVFARDSQVAVLYAHLHEPPPRPSEVRAGLPPSLDAVVVRGLAKAPDERYATCGELMTAAREALQGMPTVSAVPRTAAATPASTAGAAPGSTRQGNPVPTVERADDRPTAGRPMTAATDALALQRERPRRRLPLVLAGAAVAIVAAIALAVALGGGGDGGSGNGGAGGAGSGSPRVVGTPLQVGRRPFGVAIGPGVLWVANNDDDSVSRITTDGKSRTDINVGKQPFGLTQAGPAFWVANTGSDSVIRIDIATGKAGKPIAVGDEPYFLTADENSVFVANGADGDGTITVIDARSGKVAGDPIQVGGRLRGIVFSGSAVWVVDNRAETVKRIVNGRVTRTIAVGANPVEIAFGNNALWVTNKNDDTVSRIDLHGQGTKEKTIRVGRQPQGIAFGEGFAWVTNAKSNTVMRLDPNSGKVVGKPIPIPGQPVGIDVRNGKVWVTANDAGNVTQIDPG